MMRRAFFTAVAPAAIRSRHSRRARREWRDRIAAGATAVKKALRIIAAGPGVTLQDGGRFGYLRYGVTPAGPMDPLAFATANRAVGAPPNAAAIEVSLGGVEPVSYTHLTLP